MRLFLSICISIAAMLFTGSWCQAQQKQWRVSGSFIDARVSQVIEEIERQTDLFFYYDSKTIDSVRVTITANNETVESLLAKAFRLSGINFSIYENKVFLTRGQPIYTVLGAVQSRTDTLERNIPDTKKQVQVASTENKLYEIGTRGGNLSGKAIIAGYVRDDKNGEPITGASIQIEKLKIGVVTDEYGYYSLTVPKGRHFVSIQSIGMTDARRNIAVYGDGSMDFQMKSEITTLRNVVISSQKVNNVKGSQMGVQKIDVKSIKQVPAILGEADVLRVVTSLPGVKTVGEASTGLNVRGGSADQNLILFNDATIYNPAHFFGMFSAFNPDVVKDVTLYKSSIPARYGGRLSSVLDIGSREGNKKEVSGSAGVGPLTSRISIEGPLIKEKSSFILGARSTYANWLMKLLPDEYENSKASFYDLNLIVTHEFNKNNSVYVTGYFSSDRFNLNSDTVFGYRNRNVSVKWKHIFSNKLNAQFVGGMDSYNYNITSDRNPVNAYRLKFGIDQFYFKTHFNYYLSPNHTVDFGLNSIRYKLQPGSYLPFGEGSLVTPKAISPEHALESAVYLNDKYDVLPSLTLEAGIRFSVYNYLGPKEVNLYTPGMPRTENSFLGTKYYEAAKFIKTYSGPEYRLSIRQMLGLNSSIKAGFNTQRQYIHMLSNTAAMAPTDIWKLSDPNIRPQYGTQVSLGYYQNFKSNSIETSVEVYYKKIRDYLDYKSGANLVVNSFIEADVIGTRGKAYGAELLIKKSSGKLNGWISYAWSRILLQQADTAVGEIINEGKEYPANYDKPHDFTFIGNYRINHRFSISLSATYSTGRPITLPVGRYYYAGSYRTLYDDRNARRIPDYFRSDFSMNIDGNHKTNQKTHNSWTVGVYNLTGRKNPYSVYYVSEGGAINGYKLSIFGSAIPFVTFNIRF